jgi:acetamidase/formamidase
MKNYFLLLFLILTQATSGQNSKRIDFHPTTFYRTFSPTAKPVLNILPGDTVYSGSVDAGGFDKNGTKVTEGGNPLTGPFYIEGVSKGDVLVINLLKVSLNRNYATTFEVFVPRSLPKDIVNQLWKKMKPVDWHLDLETGFGSPKIVHEHLQNFKVPLNPFLGCVGVAPEEKEIKTYDSGPFGGNLDFCRITGSATIYLPVFNNGALLYLGDGHAVQGDGELTGSALETSMDFAFTVRVIKKGKLKLSFPRIEDATYIMAVGLDKNLDDALKIATLNLLDWLQNDYQLSLEEATQVIGTSIEYRIAEIADPKVEVVAMIKKELLKGLKKYD